MATGALEIMKIIFINGNIEKAQKTKKEVEMMNICAHKYIISVLDCFIENDKICVVMSYANQHDLRY